MKWNKIWNSAIVALSRYYPYIWGRGGGVRVRKTTKNLKSAEPVYQLRFEPSTSPTQAQGITPYTNLFSYILFFYAK
jgi:hypothetical protein